MIPSRFIVVFLHPSSSSWVVLRAFLFCFISSAGFLDVSDAVQFDAFLLLFQLGRFLYEVFLAIICVRAIDRLRIFLSVS